MTTIIKQLVLEFLTRHIGTLPEAIRVNVLPVAGKFEVWILHDGTQVWHVHPCDHDAVLDILEVEVGLVEQKIHRLAYSTLAAR